MTVAITGATGLVGRALVLRLVEDGQCRARAVVRRQTKLPAGVEQAIVSDLAPTTDWRSALSGASVVVHLAARVHVMRESARDPLAEYRRINVEATLNLARQAAAVGVQRFVFMSSLKANGESGRFTEDDAAAPEDPYGISKYEAEVGLRQIAASTALEVVIVRPPLVYGPGVRANFAALMKAVARGVPLPFGAVNNRRSFVALDNLVDFIVVCLSHPAAANQTFFVSDADDVSTPDLVRRIAAVMSRPARLIPVPPRLILAAAACVGRREVARRLVGSLQVDISKARRVLGWTPPIALDEGLRRAVGHAARHTR